MRSIIYLYFAFFASSKLIAGDIPCGATLLSTDDPSFVTFDNAANSNSGIAPPPYGGYIGPDTWISFIMPSGGFYLILNGVTLVDPAIAIYEGPCSDPKLLYNVLDNNCDGDPNPLLFIDKLNVGQQYYIRIWAQDGSPNGIFEIKMIQTISAIPDFIAFADATIVGDCIELTQNTNTQQGCAWYQNPIDFTLPFSHEMTANFGTLDGNGADGICLVYQSNGQDFCGGTGEGIGAGGMPNSAIFEFDTWQNGNLNDPVQDHCSFNVNGNMNHNSSIDGPTTLGNIEDGLDHSILFEWEPAGNWYVVYFDDILVLSGSYDIINNCFGGSTTAFWGYTSATGGSTNLHVICPIVETFEPSYTEYNEVDICEGESFMGHTESGFYVDFIPGANGCQYQLNTLIEVHEISEPEYLYEIVCEGEFILVADEVFTLPDLYEINTYTEFGCDSVIYLQLENVITSIEVDPPPLITCDNATVQLVPNPTSNYDITNVNYTWSGNGITTGQEILLIDEPGTYFLTAQITSNGMTCLTFTNITVEIDTLSPILENVNDVFLDCTNFATDTLLFVSNLNNNIEHTWIYEDSIIGLTDTINIMGEGLYTVIATDTTNGCMVSDSLVLTMSNDIPNIELHAENLDCQTQSINPFFSSTGIIDTILWNFNNEFYSYDSIPSISQAGNYSVYVISQDGCKSTASLNIEIDTIKPDIVLYDSILPCDILALDLYPIVDPNMTLEWNGTNLFSDTSAFVTVTENGWYHLSVTDPNNHCTNSDSSFIQFKGSSPSLDIGGDTINCYNPSVDLDLNVDQTDLTFSWQYQSGIYSVDEDIQVNSPGWYFIEAINENGCFAMDSAYILADFTSPIIDVVFDTLNCQNTTASVSSSIIDGDIISWNGPNSFVSTEESFTTTNSGQFFVSTINSISGCITIDTIEILNTAIIPEFTINSATINCTSKAVDLPFSLETPYLNLQWTGPDNFTSNTINPNVSQEGEYSVYIEFEGECFLDTSLVISLDTIPPSFHVDFDSITCTSPLASITTTLIDPDVTFILTSPDGSTTSSTQYTGQDSGFYYLYLEATNGCISTGTIHIPSFLDKPIVSVSGLSAITCTNPQINILATSEVNNLTYNWIGPNNFSSNVKDIDISEEGTYTLTAINEYGCKEEIELFIDAYLESPEISLEGEDIYCDNPSCTIVYDASDEISTVLWQSENNFLNLLDSIITEDAGWYFIHIENNYGCINEDSIYIEAFVAGPDVFLLTPDTLVVNVDNPNSQIEIEVQSSTDFDINWIPEDGLSCSECLDPIIIANGVPKYEILITDEYGCTTSQFIHVRYQQSLKVYIPNVFSPGKKDDNNDFFTLYGNDNIAIINSMLIYDRWGNLVAQNNNFEHNNPSLGWDGHISGRLGSSGVYVYLFQITTKEGELLNYHGTVTLL